MIGNMLIIHIEHPIVGLDVNVSGESKSKILATATANVRLILSIFNVIIQSNVVVTFSAIPLCRTLIIYILRVQWVEIAIDQCGVCIMYPIERAHSHIHVAINTSNWSNSLYFYRLSPPHTFRSISPETLSIGKWHQSHSPSCTGWTWLLPSERGKNCVNLLEMWIW